ncbi:MAG: type II toxin-antitoxin system MqsA family antitoxin [Chloroflexi bacterium]|nr:type II toxin-antitoxin system MqsA family antitoxin [Chloroflexota bacterium]MBI4315652.1 type II toxin-antitoxin system MqsA family antitoxin [Chloroflexota bacterium]
MNCVICKQAEIIEGKTTITLERDGLTLVIKNVPASVCPDCGEAYVTEAVTAQLLRTAEETAAAQAVVDVREYSSAR